MLKFSEYKYLIEAINTVPPEILRDAGMEHMIKGGMPDESHDSIKVSYTPEMDDNWLRLIQFKNEHGYTEFHIHNYSTGPGKSIEHPSTRTFLNTLNLLHHEAKKVIEQGGKVFLQSAEHTGQHQTYKTIANKLAGRSGKTVKDLGKLPITTAPWLKGEAMLIEDIIIAEGKLFEMK